MEFLLQMVKINMQGTNAHLNNKTQITADSNLIQSIVRTATTRLLLHSSSYSAISATELKKKVSLRLDLHKQVKNSSAGIRDSAMSRTTNKSGSNLRQGKGTFSPYKNDLEAQPSKHSIGNKDFFRQGKAGRA
jgi:hypothetical protein